MLCQLRYIVAVCFLSLIVFGGVVELACGAAGSYVANCQASEAAHRCCCDKSAGPCKCKPEATTSAFLGIPQMTGLCCTGGHGGATPHGADLPPSTTWKFLPPIDEVAVPTFRFDSNRYPSLPAPPLTTRGARPPVPPPKG